MISLSRYLVPFSYFFITRVPRKFQKISFYIIYLIPYLFFIICNYGKFTFINCLQVVIAIVLVNYVYENGYLQNDIFTVLAEFKPTKRIQEQEVSYITKNFKTILVARFTIILGLSLLLLIIGMNFAIIVITLSFLLQVIFYIYNCNRSYFNLFILPVLTFLRFYTPAIPFLLTKGDFFGMGFLFMLYPFLRFLEFMKEPRFYVKYISSIIPSVDLFRVYYYIAITILGFFILHGENLFILYSCVFFLTYRFFGFILVKRNDSLSFMLKNSTKKDFR